MFEKKPSLSSNHRGETGHDFVSKPPLCLSCKKNDDPSEEVFCILNRAGQKESVEFHCVAYQATAF